MTNLSTNIQKEINVRSCRREIVKEIERQKKDRRKDVAMKANLSYTYLSYIYPNITCMSLDSLPAEPAS